LGEIAEFLESRAVAKKIVEDRKKLPDGFLDEEARRVKIGVWVRDLLEKQISKYTLATHVGRFANPDSTVHLYVESKERPDGYLQQKIPDLLHDLCGNFVLSQPPYPARKTFQGFSSSKL
jgi:hypothetical protein